MQWTKWDIVEWKPDAVCIKNNYALGNGYGVAIV